MFILFLLFFVFSFTFTAWQHILLKTIHLKHFNTRVKHFTIWAGANFMRENPQKIIPTGSVFIGNTRLVLGVAKKHFCQFAKYPDQKAMYLAAKSVYTLQELEKSITIGKKKPIK